MDLQYNSLFIYEDYYRAANVGDWTGKLDMSSIGRYTPRQLFIYNNAINTDLYKMIQYKYVNQIAISDTVHVSEDILDIWSKLTQPIEIQICGHIGSLEILFARKRNNFVLKMRYGNLSRLKFCKYLYHVIIDYPPDEGCELYSNGIRALSVNSTRVVNFPIISQSITFVSGLFGLHNLSKLPNIECMFISDIYPISIQDTIYHIIIHIPRHPVSTASVDLIRFAAREIQDHVLFINFYNWYDHRIIKYISDIATKYVIYEDKKCKMILTPKFKPYMLYVLSKNIHIELAKIIYEYYIM
jgi:hypothetical protein